MVNIQTGTFSRCHKYLDGMGDINTQSVRNLPKEVRDFLREVSPKRLKELAQMNCFAADKIKTELDDTYGTNNYIIVAIGRSLSSIAELLSHMGVDTKILPLSGLRRSELSDIKKDDLITYKNFLAEKGLSKEDLKKNKDKEYVLVDYTHYGRSLSKAKELLKKDELLGEADNISIMPAYMLLGTDYDERGFDTILSCSRFKDYAYVGKLPVERLGDVYDVCSPESVKDYQGNINKGIRKLFWFNVFDSFLKDDFKDIIPHREIRAINEHYYSIKALRNSVNKKLRELKKELNSIENKNK